MCVGGEKDALRKLLQKLFLFVHHKDGTHESRSVVGCFCRSFFSVVDKTIFEPVTSRGCIELQSCTWMLTGGEQLVIGA